MNRLENNGQEPLVFPEFQEQNQKPSEVSVFQCETKDVAEQSSEKPIFTAKLQHTKEHVKKLVSANLSGASRVSCIILCVCAAILLTIGIIDAIWLEDYLYLFLGIFFLALGLVFVLIIPNRTVEILYRQLLESHQGCEAVHEYSFCENYVQVVELSTQNVNKFFYQQIKLIKVLPTMIVLKTKASLLIGVEVNTLQGGTTHEFIQFLQQRTTAMVKYQKK